MATTKERARCGSCGRFLTFTAPREIPLKGEPPIYVDGALTCSGQRCVDRAEAAWEARGEDTR